MNIYFSGIGGVGIGALASIAHSAGYGVFGSDQNSSLMIEELSKKDIEIEIGKQDGHFLKIHRKRDRLVCLYCSLT